jgi:hypothetical protein
MANRDIDKEFRDITGTERKLLTDIEDGQVISEFEAIVAPIIYERTNWRHVEKQLSNISDLPTDDEYLADIGIEIVSQADDFDNLDYVFTFTDRIKSGLLVTLGSIVTLSVATVVYLQAKGR